MTNGYETLYRYALDSTALAYLELRESVGPAAAQAWWVPASIRSAIASISGAISNRSRPVTSRVPGGSQTAGPRWR